MSQQTPDVTPGTKTIQDFSHSHPYQYLTKLNQIYTGYNRSTVKDFSSASKIKLPFYKFSSMKVPTCFESNYAKEKKELFHYHSVQVAKIDDGEKKLWKQHREIIQKYLEQKQSKKNRVQKSKNKEFVQKILSKDKNNIFLKKIIQKGTKFQYDERKFEQQVLNKLKNINKSKKSGVMRCQTAKCVTSETKGDKIQEVNHQIDKYKVSPMDYLEFDQERDIILKYKALIKKADCSISQKNINKASQLLSHMQKMVNQNKYI